MGVAAMARVETDNHKALVTLSLPGRLAVFHENNCYPRITAVARWFLGRPWWDTRCGSTHCRGLR
jgi:hypothetical protein